jgi:hypothetical protein
MLSGVGKATLKFHKLSFRQFQTRICLANTQVNRTRKMFFQICVFSKFLFLSTPKSQANLQYLMHQFASHVFPIKFELDSIQ